MAAREGSHYNNSKKFIKKVYIIKYYSHYSKKGYNFYTCIVKIKDIDNSDTSKE